MKSEAKMKPAIMEAQEKAVTAGAVLPLPSRTLRYTTSVKRETNEKILKDMLKLVEKNPEQAVGLFVTSPGGASGVAMSFYDTVRHIIRPNLITIGSGDVDSSGVIIFLSGNRRYISARTSMLLHPAGRIFDHQRYTVKEMEAMLAEDRLKDEQYATTVAENSGGKLTTEEVLLMMERHTVLAPADLLAYGLADELLP